MFYEFSESLISWSSRPFLISLQDFISPNQVSLNKGFGDGMRFEFLLTGRRCSRRLTSKEGTFPFCSCQLPHDMDWVFLLILVSVLHTTLGAGEVLGPSVS